MKRLTFLLCWLAAAARAADPVTEIASLRREIARHDALYHQVGAPVISDAAYDELRRQLADLERRHAEAAKTVVRLAPVPDDRTSRFPTVRHRTPMLSLEKAHTEADLRAFDIRVRTSAGLRDISYVIEPKYDGIAVSLVYEHGQLVRAVTRGNGMEGDDITGNVRRVANVPALLRTLGPPPDWVEIRGELYLPFEEFHRVNAERHAVGQAAFASPRALAAGTMRQLHPGEFEMRGIRFVCFGLTPRRVDEPPTYGSRQAILREWGLPVTEQVWQAPDSTALVSMIRELGTERSRWGFPTDGVVVKVESLALQTRLGSSESAPRWAIAFKFTPQRAETRVRAITVQVGRTGVLTPVAELAPVQLDGVRIARATLHNRAEVIRLDVRVGDWVYLERAGDVIPAIVGVNRDRRPRDALPFVFPESCPACATPAESRDSEIAVRCPNSKCSAKLCRRLEHFAAKDCMDITGLGPTLIEALVNQRLVTDLPDLYGLTREQLLTVPRMAETSADRLLAAIERSREAEPWRVIHALGLPGVGASTAKKLASRHGTLTAFSAAEPAARVVILALLRAGVQPRTPSPGPGTANDAGSAAAKGRTFVLTGTLPTLTREAVTQLIRDAGGEVSNVVSPKTSFLVAGANPGGAKLAAARKHGVPIIGEHNLLELLRRPAKSPLNP